MSEIVDEFLCARLAGFRASNAQLIDYYKSVVLPVTPTRYFDNETSYVGWAITSRNGHIDDGVRPIRSAVGSRSSKRGTVPTRICIQYGLELLEQLSGMGLEPYRARMMRLESEGRGMIFHRDAVQPVWRLHIPIFTNPKCFFEWRLKDGQVRRVHMPTDGSAWLVRVDVEHRAVNLSPHPAERVHLLVSLGKQPCIEQLGDGRVAIGGGSVPSERPSIVPMRSSIPCPPQSSVFAEHVATRVLAEVRHQTLSRERGSSENVSGTGPVYVAARRQGHLQAAIWAGRDDWHTGLVLAIRDLQRNGRIDEKTDVLEVCLSYPPKSCEVRKNGKHPANVHRGILGLEVSCQGRVERFSPTEMIARNLDFPTALELAKKRLQVGSDKTLPILSPSTFKAHQFLILLKDPLQVVPLYRANRIVLDTDVSWDAFESYQAAMAEWLLEHLHPNGRMTYKYWPSRGVEAPSNNVIRQIMATICLGRWARRLHDPHLLRRAQNNLEYNLQTFYREEAAVGYLEEQNEVKLGAAALAALAIREAGQPVHLSERRMRLEAFVQQMWKPTGEFRTFFKPARRDGANQNFYPGQALLLWADLLSSKQDPRLLEQFMTSARYYRHWHHTHRNPAFVPWHTQAYVALWRRTRDPELRDFVFEMNDWLLEMQQCNVPCDDLRGRFYDVAHPEYGPPHASSDGVYLEGVADAYWLARSSGDALRSARYCQVIMRGLRNVMQLQFRDDAEAFYVSKKSRVLGGLRTTVYDNAIRVDNVQHNLIAAMKIELAVGRSYFCRSHNRAEVEVQSAQSTCLP